ncbi:MAG: transglutaminaseTgpA domain-containing protein [Acidimicrobiaceae bacterium]|nr:transglutaminaseTgpA domain-containing protein [Acidimicrobiaceae bacterium]
MATRPGSGPGSGRGGGWDWLLEVALIAVTVVVAAGMERLFTDTSFLRDVLALALASHVVAAAIRRVGLRAVGASLLSVASLAVTATVLLYPETAWFVVPTPGTVSAAFDHLVEAWDVVNGSPAPVVPVPGLVLIAGTALGLCAFLADAVAFRLRSAGWAVAPAAAIYGFTAAVGTGDAAVLHGTLACGAIGLTMVALRLRNRRADVWIEAGPGRGTRAMARVGGAALLAAVVAGAVAGPALPGARAEPWIDLERLEVTDAAPWVDAPPPTPEPWADLAPASGGGPASLEGADAGPRVLVSPLVQVRSRLIDLSDVELFAVAVPEDERQYWRLTSLDEFDGDAWRARSEYEEVSGPLAATLDPSAASGPHLSQTVTLTGLGNSYLPAAYELRRVIDDGGVAMEYEALSGSLIKTRRAALVGPRRFTYAVDSAVPAIGDPDRLRRSETSMLEEGFLATNTRLPDDVQELVRAEAERITAGARSDYHRALLLQDHFRLDGGFRYDLQVHSEGVDGLEDFLFDVRAGYCQQFASAYGALARSIGLPTRVAVGFTWGEWQPERDIAGAFVDGAYVVRGRHAHAWPEVYFAGTGWTRFEPTPGRGAPGDFAITGHVADQAGPGPDAAAAVADQGVEPAEAPGRPDSAGPDPAGAPTDDPEAGSGLVRRSEPSTDPQAGASESPSRLSGALLAALALVALGFAFGLVPVLKRLQWRRRRDRLADDPAGLIDFWWSNALEALALVELDPKSSETPQELARRVVSIRPAVGPIQELAVIATHGRYARETPPLMAIRAGVVGSLVVGACRRQATVLSRLAAALDPSTLVSRARR